MKKISSAEFSISGGALPSHNFTYKKSCIYTEKKQELRLLPPKINPEEPGLNESAAVSGDVAVNFGLVLL